MKKQGFLEPKTKLFDSTFILVCVHPIFVMLTEMERKYLRSKAEFLFPTCPLSFLFLPHHCHICVKNSFFVFILIFCSPETFLFPTLHAQNCLSRQRYSEGTPLPYPSPPSSALFILKCSTKPLPPINS